MVTELEILLADDDLGHVNLIKKNLKRSGITNPIRHFSDGQEILDYFYKNDGQNELGAFLILLDIRMPKVDGISVLKTLKSDDRFREIPIIMLTTTDDPKEIKKCHEIGCNNYITKPIEYDEFVDAIKHLGLFLKIVKVPSLN